jgi:hypothetical protein
LRGERLRDTQTPQTRRDEPLAHTGSYACSPGTGRAFRTLGLETSTRSR